MTSVVVSLPGIREIQASKFGSVTTPETTTALTDGAGTLALDPTEATWCWRFIEHGPGGQTRYCLVPDTGSITYLSLVDVDPGTLMPTVEPADPAWEAIAQAALTAAATKADKAGLPISVLDYGADRTGVANSTSAFVAALSASSATGRPVSVPAGIFKIDPDTLTVPKALIGEGMDLVSLRSSGAANTGVGLAMPTAYTEVSGVEMRGFKAAIKVTNHSTRILRNKISYNLIGIDYESNSFLGRLVGNNIIFNNSIGVKVGNLPYQLLIAHNIIDNNNGIGIAMHGGSNGAVIVDNSIEGNRRYSDGSNLGCGILVTGTYQSRFKIDGNWFEANGETNASIDVAMRGPDADAASKALIDGLVSALIPAEYQSLFSGRVLGGAVSITRNSFVFTQLGILGTMGAVGAMAIRENSFKGVKGKFNKHIYLTLQSNYCGRIKIEDNSWKNTDDVTIDPEVETGIGGTIVHSNLSTGDLPVTVDGSRLIAGPAAVQVFTASGTWSAVYGAVSYDVTVISGGSGGGSGRRDRRRGCRCGRHCRRGRAVLTDERPRPGTPAEVGNVGARRDDGQRADADVGDAARLVPRRPVRHAAGLAALPGAGGQLGADEVVAVRFRSVGVVGRLRFHGDRDGFGLDCLCDRLGRRRAGHLDTRWLANRGHGVAGESADDEGKSECDDPPRLRHGPPHVRIGHEGSAFSRLRRLRRGGRRLRLRCRPGWWRRWNGRGVLARRGCRR